MNKTELGSKTAKGGFANEKAICEKFNGWKKDKEAQEWLKTGIKKIRDKRRLFLNEMPEMIQKKIIGFFEKNRIIIIIISDIIKGRGGLSADWMLVTRFNRENKTTTWTLRDIIKML